MHTMRMTTSVATSGRSKTRGLRVLYCEDDPVLRDMLQEHYLMLAYTQSVVADQKTIAWLKAGGNPATEPWRYHAKVSVTKAKLVALLVKTAKPLGVPVPIATELYP